MKKQVKNIKKFIKNTIYFKTRFCTHYGPKIHFYGCSDPNAVGRPFSRSLKKIKNHMMHGRFCKEIFNVKHFIMKYNRRNPNPKSKKIYFLIFRKVARNIFISLVTGQSRRLIKYFSSGIAGFKGPKKPSAVAAFATGAAMGKYIFKKFRKNPTKNFILVLKTSVTKEVQESIFGIKKYVPWFEKKTAAIFTNFKVSHSHGLRPKKPRRLLFAYYIFF
jgi:hypothetical protein